MERVERLTKHKNIMNKLIKKIEQQTKELEVLAKELEGTAKELEEMSADYPLGGTLSELLENLKRLSSCEACEACGEVFKPEYRETLCPDCQDEHEEALDEQMLCAIYRDRGSEWIIKKLKEADKGEIFNELI